jgi:hypothetical protein
VIAQTLMNAESSTYPYAAGSSSGTRTIAVSCHPA